MLKWDGFLPAGFFNQTTYAWVLKGNKVLRRTRNRRIHAEIWGEWVWNVEERGYYNPEHGIVTCHGKLTPAILRKLGKIFTDAIYYYDNV